MACVDFLIGSPPSLGVSGKLRLFGEQENNSHDRILFLGQWEEPNYFYTFLSKCLDQFLYRLFTASIFFTSFCIVLAPSEALQCSVQYLQC